MSESRNFPRSFRFSGLNVSFFGRVSVWQYWQFFAGMPAAFALVNESGVASATPTPEPRHTSTIIQPVAVIFIRNFSSRRDRPLMWGPGLLTLQDGRPRSVATDSLEVTVDESVPARRRSGR